MPVCQYCKAQLVTEKSYCDDCSLEVVGDMLEGDVIAAYQEGIITDEECRFIFGSTTTHLPRPTRKDSFKSLER